ncbi:hypothetical protein BCH308197_2195 [Bacillus cereus H3081.97]|nr:hypothetical protein bcf_10775 [Bacillus cereus F837/76]EDZ57921.1 hypothetical protein BCH308197_2195 [Bacillus cereus H3081.97]KKZ91883.1 hypothetical protein B4086_2113 [Bacillus cereus]
MVMTFIQVNKVTMYGYFQLKNYKRILIKNFLNKGKFLPKEKKPF